MYSSVGSPSKGSEVIRDGPMSPDRRIFTHRTTSTLSHRHTDSQPIDATQTPRAPERRPPLKAKRSSLSNGLFARMPSQLPPPSSPPAKKRAFAQQRTLQRAFGATALLLFCGMLLFYRERWRAGSPSSGTGHAAVLVKDKPSPKAQPSSVRSRPTRNATHTHDELHQLQSTLAQPHSASIAALLVCTDASTVNLRPLIASLERQTVQLSYAVLLCEVDEGTTLGSPQLAVAASPVPLDADPARAVLQAARALEADFLFILDADTPALSAEHLDTLVHAAGTVEYSAALLTSRGLALHPVHESTCHPVEDDDLRPRSAPIHIPTAPYLVQRSWLTQATAFGSGMRLDLPHGHALSLALWLKVGITAFALPLAASPTTPCPRYTVDEELAPSFLAERATVGGEPPRSSEEYLATIARGIVAVIVADAEELRGLASLACSIAAGASASVVVYMGEGPTDDDPRLPCVLEVKRGGALDAAAVDVLIYASEATVTVPELRAISAWTRGTRDRRGRVGPTAIRVPVEMASSLDWMATLDVEALRSWHQPRIDLAVITNNRPESLARLLSSLLTAEYYGDEVQLAISLEQTADLATQRLIESFDWPHGTVTVRHRIILGGLMPAITEAWYPASNDSYGVFLEDDVELSPLFYGWSKYNVLKYRYGATMTREQSSRLYGVSFYQQKALELRPEGRRPFDAHALFGDLDLDPASPYLCQVPCSWGAVYFPEVWREFHLYLALRLSEIALGIADVVVPDARSNRWPRSWKKYFVELVYARGYVMLYPNYPEWRSFSTNHLEAGTHIRTASLVDAKRKAQFEVPLAPRGASLLEGLPNGRLPGWLSLPVIDLWGSVTSEAELVGRGWTAMQALGVCPVRTEPPLGTYDARELLCERRSSVR